MGNRYSSSTMFHVAPSHFILNFFARHPSILMCISLISHRLDLYHCDGIAVVYHQHADRGGHHQSRGCHHNGYDDRHWEEPYPRGSRICKRTTGCPSRSDFSVQYTQWIHNQSQWLHPGYLNSFCLLWAHMNSPRDIPPNIPRWTDWYIWREMVETVLWFVVLLIAGHCPLGLQRVARSGVDSDISDSLHFWNVQRGEWQQRELLQSLRVLGLHLFCVDRLHHAHWLSASEMVWFSFILSLSPSQTRTDCVFLSLSLSLSGSRWRRPFCVCWSSE